jgi:fructokinase
MVDVVTLGELLIDFVSTESGVSLVEAPVFQKAPGGAPANVAVGVARLGARSGFIGKVGDDDFGHFLAQTLAQNGVDTSALRFSHQARTMLAFVSLRADGERDFMFYRHPSADMLLRPDEIDRAYVGAARIFHYGSISLISEPSRSATLAAVETAVERGVLVSYDPNLRLNLWSSREQPRDVGHEQPRDVGHEQPHLAGHEQPHLAGHEQPHLAGRRQPHLAGRRQPADAAREGMLTGWRYAQVAKVSEDELAFLSGEDDFDAAVEALWHERLRLLVVTAGRGGCRYATVEARGQVPGFSVETVDTTGAGDGFVAGLLVGLLEDEQVWENVSALEQVLRFANAVGALTTTRRGAIPALPTREQALKLTEAES